MDLKKKAPPKRGLGRGLGALLPTASSSGKGLLHHCPIGHISPDPEQPRKRFTDTHLEELAASIKEHGVIQPLLVRKTDQPGRYILVAGERRLRAAGMAELEEVPVIVMELDDRRGLEVSLIENLQREDLNPIEEAEGYQRLAKEFSLSHTAIAELLGKDRTTVTNTIRLLNLGARARTALIEESITMGHGRALLGLVDEARQEEALAALLERGLSVRELEELVRRLKKGGTLEPEPPVSEPEPTSTLPPEIESRLGRLSERFQTKACIRRRKNGRGRLEFEFRSEEELERLLDLLE